MDQAQWKAHPGRHSHERHGEWKLGDPDYRARAGKHEKVESNIGPGSRLPGGGDITVRRRALPSQQEEF